jgi:hypothetical protein
VLRSALTALLAFTACGGAGRADLPDSAMMDMAEWDADYTVDDYPPRSPTAVIVGDTRVLWSLGPASCALESGPECPPSSSTVLASAAPSDSPSSVASTKQGAFIVGDENELFFMNVDDFNASYLVRVLPTSTNTFAEAISFPRSDVSGPAIDTTHVYWADGDGGPFTIKRTSRGGDGTDVETVATSPLRPSGMFVFAGYVFVGSSRVPITGGTLEPFTQETNWRPFAFGPDLLYIVNYLPPNGHRVRISSMTVDGDMQVLVDDLPQWEAPTGGLYDLGDLFWTTSQRKLYKMPATGGPRTEVANNVTSPIGLTEDAILYDFTRSGYETISR